jgi:hypothetical protein
MDTVTVVLMAFIKIAEEAFIRFPLRGTSLSSM